MNSAFTAQAVHIAQLVIVPLHLVFQRGKLGFMLRGYPPVENDVPGTVAVEPSYLPGETASASAADPASDPIPAGLPDSASAPKTAPAYREFHSERSAVRSSSSPLPEMRAPLWLRCSYSLSPVSSGPCRICFRILNSSSIYAVPVKRKNSGHSPGAVSAIWEPRPGRGSLVWGITDFSR